MHASCNLFRARDRQTTQRVVNLTHLLRTQHFRAIADSNQVLKLGIEQTAKLTTDALQAVHALNVTRR